MARTTLLVLIAAASWMPATAREDLWGRLTSPDRQNVEAKPNEVRPTPSQRQSIAKLIKSRPAPWDCEGDDEWLNNLRYSSVSLSVTRPVLLVEAGQGCARGGQGANGAMWLIRFDGRDAVLLADPQQGFDGFLYSIEPTTSRGYRDVIVGWHVGGGETGLGYFRFDGTAYHGIGSATLRYDRQGIPQIVQR